MSSSEDRADRGARRRAAIALLFLVPAPSIGTFAAMVAAPGLPVGQGSFAASKVWLLAFPLLWCTLVERSRLAFPRPRAAGMTAGVVSGVVIAGAIVAGYLALGDHLIDPEVVREELGKVGFDSPAFYIPLAVYWCLVNSLLEEYVWRWFVFSQCARLWSLRPAAAMAGFFFTLHHIVALQVYLDALAVAICATGVWIGGTTWSWIYGRWKNIWAAWVSHVLADIAVFAIGYVLLFG